MKNQIQIFSYNGSNITMRKENGVVMVNLTEVAKAFPNKNLSDIVNSQEMKEYVKALSEIENSISADYVQVVKGGNPNEQGTWAHQKVAIRVAQKLSPHFAVMVDTKIEELLTTGVATASDDDEAILHAMNVLQKRLQAKEQRVQILEGENEHLEQENKILAPKAQYTDEVLQSVSTYTSTQVAKWLGYRNTNYFHRLLKEKRVIFNQSGQWLPYAQYSGCGYTDVRTTKYIDGKTGETRTNSCTVWTEKGRMFLRELLFPKKAA